MNLYGYGNNSPVEYIDRTGKIPVVPYLIAGAVITVFVLTMGMEAPSDTKEAPANVLGMGLAVAGLRGLPAGGMCRAAAESLPALTPGPGGKMLGEAVGHLRGMPGAKRVGAFRQFSGEITKETAGQWSAKELAAKNATIFAGEGGEALVFDGAGNMFVATWESELPSNLSKVDRSK